MLAGVRGTQPFFGEFLVESAVHASSHRYGGDERKDYCSPLQVSGVNPADRCGFIYTINHGGWLRHSEAWCDPNFPLEHRRTLASMKNLHPLPCGKLLAVSIIELPGATHAPPLLPIASLSHLKCTNF